MTLIEQRKSDGSLAGRCDARCYRALHAPCVCICGGKNHGRGLDKAIENVSALLKENPELKPTSRVTDMLNQLDLPFEW